MSITDPVSGKLRIEVTIKPDLSVIDSRSNIWGALGLDCFDLAKQVPPDDDGEACEGHQSVSSKSSSQDGSDGGDPGALARGLGDPSRMKQIDSEFDTTDKGKASGTF